MVSLFKPFPTLRGAAKIFIYGEAGTEKTRRALQMPGPLYVMDLESGSSDYGDLVNPARDRYLLTRSHTVVRDALLELSRMPPEAVGTVIIDPITVLWQSIQLGHVERQIAAGKASSPETVMFDVGVWGKLKRTYGDIMSTLLAAHYHVVMIARGKDKIDDRGNKLGYGFDGEKSTEFLAKTVIESHGDYDIVLKDRTGTFTERGRVGRVDMRKLLVRATRVAVPIQTESEAARRDAADEEEPRIRAIVKKIDGIKDPERQAKARAHLAGGGDPAKVEKRVDEILAEQDAAPGPAVARMATAPIPLRTDIGPAQGPIAEAPHGMMPPVGYGDGAPSQFEIFRDNIYAAASEDDLAKIGEALAKARNASPCPFTSAEVKDLAALRFERGTALKAVRTVG